MVSKAEKEDTPRTGITHVGGWTLGKTLGRGAYAHVRVATHPNGHKAACKILPALHRPRAQPATWDETVDAIEAHKEVVLLKALSGAGVYGVVGLEGVIEEAGWTYVFLTLYENSASAVPIPCHHTHLLTFFRRLLLTVQALHSLDISHEDLKRSNILLVMLGQPVVVDFGFSHFKAGGGDVRSAGGTLDYSSPEKVLDTKYDPKANDVWALGILLCKMLGLDHPMLSNDSDLTSANAKRKIIEGIPRFTWRKEDLQAGGVAELLEGMLNKDPQMRMTIPQILLHPYLYMPRPDPRRYKPPPLTLPEDFPSPMPASVIEDVCFLAYLNKQFVLCETTKKVRERLMGYEPCWEKRWAGMLFRWRQREELEWQDVVKIGRNSSAPIKSRKSQQPLPLREIFLSRNQPATPGKAAPPKAAQPKPKAGVVHVASRKSLIKQMKGKEASTPRVSLGSAVTLRASRQVGQPKGRLGAQPLDPSSVSPLIPTRLQVKNIRQQLTGISATLAAKAVEVGKSTKQYTSAGVPSSAGSNSEHESGYTDFEYEEGQLGNTAGAQDGLPQKHKKHLARRDPKKVNGNDTQNENQHVARPHRVVRRSQRLQEKVP